MYTVAVTHLRPMLSHAHVTVTALPVTNILNIVFITQIGITIMVMLINTARHGIHVTMILTTHASRDTITCICSCSFLMTCTWVELSTE